MLPVAKYITTHTTGNNAKDYTPVFTSGTGQGTVGGSIGTWTPTYFAIHNPATSGSVTATVWTIDQGTAGSGAGICVPFGQTVYVNVAKLTVSGTVTLFGTLNTPMVY
jgi:hypothetical protein